MEIRLDKLDGPEVAALIHEHLLDMHASSPPESIHALDLSRLKQNGISFWTLWDGQNLAGCGALKELDPGHGEIKSMRTARACLRRGVGSRLLQHIIDEARKRGYSRLSLETGSVPYFQPALALYRKFGFAECPPFADYKPDPYSIFMTLELGI